MSSSAVMAATAPPYVPTAAVAAAATQLPNLSKAGIIRDVWADNLEAEVAVIRDLVKKYPYIAMDTEFPGVVAKPVGTFRTPHDFYYQTMKLNVNLLKIIQIGFTLLNEKGEVPDKCCTWQFNFKFSLSDDMYAQDSIDLLTNGGISFEYFRTHGIEMAHFAELLTTSGLILCPDVVWLSFHSGYDFGYLLKMVSGLDLSDRESDFTSLLKIYFPNIYDIKCVLRLTDFSHAMGLDSVADVLGVRRIGTAHQAGSDSLMTGHCFFKLLKDRFDSKLPVQSKGLLYGLSEDATAANGSGPAAPSAVTAAAQQASASNNTGAAAAIGGAATNSPATYTGSTPGSFPATPVMNIVMHGGKQGAAVHQASGR